MSAAQFPAGMAFNNSFLGYVHAMAHQLGGQYNLPHGVCNAMHDLARAVGIPARLSDYCVPRPLARADIPRLVEIATADICHQTNPRQCTAADFESLFIAAI